MNIQLLIDAVVRQTTVLIAQLATAGGARTPLADVAAQVFVDLARELEAQGVSRKVAADMFGLALRTYRRKIQRLAESQTVLGRSLWEAVHEHVASRPVTTRAELLRRFHRDDERTLKAVLQDLVDSGLLYRSGRGPSATYRAGTKEEMEYLRDAASDTESLDTLVWGAVYRGGAPDRATLSRAAAIPDDTLSESLERLVSAGKVRRVESGGRICFEADGFVLPLGSPIGWEAAIFDHFQAVVGTLCTKLRSDRATATDADRIGGSTYTLEVWPGHELEDEVVGELAHFRARLSALRRRVAAYNERNTPPRRRTRVVIYGGQNLTEMEDASDGSEDDSR